MIAPDRRPTRPHDRYALRDQLGMAALATAALALAYAALLGWLRWWIL